MFREKETRNPFRIINMSAAMILLAVVLLFTGGRPVFAAVGKVTGLKQTAAAETTFTVAWNAVSGAEKYRVSSRKGTSGNFSYTTTTKTSYTLTKKEPGSSYQVRICAVKGSEVGAYNGTITAVTTPAKVTGLKQTAAAETSFTVTWKAVSGAEKYRVSYRKGTSGNFTYTTTTSTSCTIKNRDKNSAYQVRVCGVRGNYLGAYNGTIKAYTIPNVTGLKQQNAGSSSVWFTYDAVSGAQAYKYAYSTSKNGSYKELPEVTSSYEAIDDLAAGSSYYVKVKVKKNGIYGSYGNPVEMVTSPSGVADVEQTGATETSITVKFSNVKGATGYDVEYEPYSAFIRFSHPDLKTKTVNGSTATLTGLPKNSRYEVRAQPFRKSSTGFTAYGSTMFLAEYVCTLPTKGVITELRNVEDTPKEYKITWEDYPYAEGVEFTFFDKAGKAVKTETKEGGAEYTYRYYQSCGSFTVKLRAYILIAGGKKLYGAYSDPKSITSPYPNHNWTETTSPNPPTCTKAGVRTYNCPYCESVKNVNTPAFGHDWSGWYRISLSQHERVCSHDGTHLEKQAHTWDAGEVITEATRTSTGTVKYTCTACFASKTATIPKLTKKDVTQKQQDAKMTKLNTDEDPGGAVYRILQLKAVKVTGNTIKLKWTKVKGATGYVIYGSKCGSKYKKLKTIKSGNTVTWTQKKLKKGQYYKYLATALEKRNGMTMVAATSKSIHVATAGGKKGNYKSVKLKNVKKNSVTLSKGKTFKIKASAIPAKKNLKVASHRGLKYESSKPKVAKVDKKGKIKAVKKGTAYIFVYAQNGVSQKIKVVVK